MTHSKCHSELIHQVHLQNQYAIWWINEESQLLERRFYEHKHKLVKGFTQKYNVNKLIYFEIFDDVGLAISREKQIKGYSRTKKVALIDQLNSNWDELHYNEKI